MKLKFQIDNKILTFVESVHSKAREYAKKGITLITEADFAKATTPFREQIAALLNWAKQEINPVAADNQLARIRIEKERAMARIDHFIKKCQDELKELPPVKMRIIAKVARDTLIYFILLSVLVILDTILNWYGLQILGSLLVAIFASFFVALLIALFGHALRSLWAWGISRGKKILLTIALSLFMIFVIAVLSIVRGEYVEEFVSEDATMSTWLFFGISVLLVIISVCLAFFVYPTKAEQKEASENEELLELWKELELKISQAEAEKNEIEAQFYEDKVKLENDKSEYETTEAYITAKGNYVLAEFESTYRTVSNNGGTASPPDE